jgi:hypothetical protein
MAQKRLKPARSGKAAGLGIDFCSPAKSAEAFTPTPLDLQERRLVRRFGLSPSIARLIARHAFGEASS